MMVGFDGEKIIAPCAALHCLKLLSSGCEFYFPLAAIQVGDGGANKRLEKPEFPIPCPQYTIYGQTKRSCQGSYLLACKTEDLRTKGN